MEIHDTARQTTDFTGTMRWNPATKKRVRQRKEGFTAWQTLCQKQKTGTKVPVLIVE
jgi:hypothetical protein